MRKKHWFAAIYGALLAITTLAGIECIAGFFAPTWPQRAMRSVAVTPGTGGNSWGMNDRERTLAKPADVRLRATFVGDSFVDLRFNSQTLPEAVEHLAAEAGMPGLEAVNLGVVATDPPSYYYRTRDVALELSPDAILLFFFSGNDFVQQGFVDQRLPPLVSASPGESIVGRVMPRTDWVLVNSLGLSDFFRDNKLIANEHEKLAAIVDGPSNRRLPDLVGHMKRHYFPDLSEARLTEILSRGSEAFWAAFRPRTQDREYLEGWIPYLIVSQELKVGPVDEGRDQEPLIKATLSWLVATKKLADSRNIPFRVFIIPSANVSPDFVDFWKPWPRYAEWWTLSDLRHERLVEELGQAGVPFVDLRPDLFGVPGAYRLSDAHWTEKGTLIVAHRVLDELTTMKPH